jgi:hypothetical protein
MVLDVSYDDRPSLIDRDANGRTKSRGLAEISATRNGKNVEHLYFTNTNTPVRRGSPRHFLAGIEDVGSAQILLDLSIISRDSGRKKNDNQNTQQILHDLSLRRYSQAARKSKREKTPLKRGIFLRQYFRYNTKGR